MRRDLLAVVLATLAGASIWGGFAVPADRAMAVAPGYAPASRTVCHEDRPCWIWSRMGNRRRGVVTMRGTPIVVGPCTYARLWRAGSLDRTHRSQRMRGDWWALLHGCAR